MRWFRVPTGWLLSTTTTTTTTTLLRSSSRTFAMATQPSSSSSSSSSSSNSQSISIAQQRMQALQDVIGQDAGGRNMKHLICPGDLWDAARALQQQSSSKSTTASTALILSGFPCCVDQSPPTETDGPPGTIALARACAGLGYANVVILTDDCNRDVYLAALPVANDDSKNAWLKRVRIETFPPAPTAREKTITHERFQALANQASVMIACERAGPALDGSHYTMRAKNMDHLLAPLHELVEIYRTKKHTPFLAIGDGGNELGMGKVLDKIQTFIPQGELIGCRTAADSLIASSVSNWGGYALAAGAALVQAAAAGETATDANFQTNLKTCLDAMVPTEAEEIALLDRIVQAGCRDGVSGRNEPTVDGMPRETSLECLRAIRAAALGEHEA